MANMNVITEKMIKMHQHITQLKEMKPTTYEDYENDIKTKFAIERVMQLIVDLALDINNIIILSYMKKPPAANYYDSFIALGECEVIEPEFAVGIAPSTGLRNRLVHEYEKVNDRIVYESIDMMLDMYVEYMGKIDNFLGE